MNNLKKIASGIARNGLLGVGLLGMYLSHKRHLPEYITYVSYGLSCVGLYVLTAFFLETEPENEANDKGDASNEQKEETCRIVAQNVMDNLKPALEKHIAETKFKEQSEDIRLKNFLAEFEEDTKHLFERNLNEETSDLNSKEKKRTTFLRLLKKSYDMQKFSGLTDEEFNEFLKNNEQEWEKNEPDEDYNVQTLPILMKLSERRIQAAENASSGTFDEFFRKIGDELRTMNDMVNKPVPNKTSQTSANETVEESYN